MPAKTCTTLAAKLGMERATFPYTDADIFAQWLIYRKLIVEQMPLVTFCRTYRIPERSLRKFCKDIGVTIPRRNSPHEEIIAIDE